MLIKLLCSFLSKKVWYGSITCTDKMKITAMKFSNYPREIFKLHTRSLKTPPVMMANITCYDDQHNVLRLQS